MVGCSNSRVTKTKTLLAYSYNVQNDWMTISVTSFTSASDNMTTSLRQTLDEIKQVLAAAAEEDKQQ
jgi:hypothetical protein